MMQAVLIATAAMLAAQPGGVDLGQRALRDASAGKPLEPAQASGAWTLEQNGRKLCRIILDGRRKTEGSAYGVGGGASCAGLAPAAWAPTEHGLRLIGPDGAEALRLTRWSDSLFVSTTPGAADVQLRRDF